MTWQVLFPAGPASDVREAFGAWLAARDSRLIDQRRVRFDLIRSDEGELLRIMIDGDPSAEELETEPEDGGGDAGGDSYPS